MPLRSRILDHGWWKLLSLGLAALTWLTIYSARQSPVIKTNVLTFSQVPVTLLTEPSNTNKFKITPQRVRVDVGVLPKDETKISQRDVQAFADVSGAGDEPRVQRPVQAQVPRGFNVVSITVIPPTVTVERVIPPK